MVRNVVDGDAEFLRERGVTWPLFLVRMEVVPFEQLEPRRVARRCHRLLRRLGRRREYGADPFAVEQRVYIRRALERRLDNFLLGVVEVERQELRGPSPLQSFRSLLLVLDVAVETQPQI